MKKIFLLMGFCCTVNLVNAQAPQTLDHGFQDNQHKTLAVVRNSTIYSNENKLLARFERDTRGITIRNGQDNEIGYILKSDLTTEYKDGNHNTVGYGQFDRTTYVMTVQDATHRVLGYVKPGGIVENSSHSVIGYGVTVEPIWAASYFFLTKM